MISICTNHSAMTLCIVIFLLIHRLLQEDNCGSMCTGTSLLLYQLSGVQPSVVGFSDSIAIHATILYSILYSVLLSIRQSCTKVLYHSPSQCFEQAS